MEETRATTDQKFGSVQDILDVALPEHRVVFVPLWGFNVRLKYLTGVELDDLQTTLSNAAGDVDKAKAKNIRAKFAAKALVDERGYRMFKTPEQITKLGQKDAASLQLLFETVCEMNGIRERDRKRVEEELKSESEEAEEIPDSV